MTHPTPATKKTFIKIVLETFDVPDTPEKRHEFEHDVAEFSSEVFTLSDGILLGFGSTSSQLYRDPAGGVGRMLRLGITGELSAPMLTRQQSEIVFKTARQAFEKFNAVYGAVHQHAAAGGGVTPSMKDGLERLFWLNYLGPDYAEWMDASMFQGLEPAQASKLATGGWLVTVQSP